MKRFLATMLTTTLLLSSCGSTTDNTENNGASSEDELKVILLVPGNLGDQSFYDSANRGLVMIDEQLGATTKVIEMTSDATKWEPNFLDAIDGGYDIIISGGPATEKLNEIAELNPEQKFINYDTNELEPPANVYSIEYRANEMSFLVGAVAALSTVSDLENANPEPIIGFLGGMDIPGINDFLVGYIEGAQYVNPDIQVITSYAGDFGDPAKGKEIALNQYNKDADIIFNVAGGTGLGIFDAAKDVGYYAIGVDSDQSMLFEETDKEKADLIVTSGVKKIDEAILNSVKKHIDGSLEYGEHVSLGVAENVVGIVEEGNYAEMMSDEDKAKIKEIENKILNNEIEISTAFGMTTEEISKIRDSAK